MDIMEYLKSIVPKFFSSILTEKSSVKQVNLF